MNALVQTLLTIDTYTWAVFAAMATFGAGLVTSLTGSGLMAFLYFPGLLAGQLATAVGLQHLNVMFVADKSVNTIIVACLGAMLALIVLFTLTWVALAISAALTPAPRRDDTNMAALVRRRI